MVSAELERAEAKAAPTPEQEQIALSAWNASPRRPLWMQCTGEILGPSRCLEFKDGVPRGWKWYNDANEQRLKEWLAEFRCGKRQAFFRRNDQPIPPSEFDRATNWKGANDVLGQDDWYCTDLVADPVPTETRSHFGAALDLWNGRKSATDLADLNKAAAAHLAALKSAITPEQATALRELETGKGSTLATAKIFRSAPHVLAMLFGTPQIQKVRELVQILNAPDEWDGFLDPYWTVGQIFLWRLTRDPEVVDEASNDCGRLGETWGQVRAAVLFDALNLPREQVQDAADEIRRRCLEGRMTAIDEQNRPIPAIEWRHLKIVLDTDNLPNVLRHGQSSIVPAYENVVFSRIEVLREFKPAEADDTDEEADGGGAPERQSRPIPTKLNWEKLKDEEFERLIFSLISDEPGYENPQWLTQTHAPDRGRDLSVTRVTRDRLSGQFSYRVIIQCRHYLKRSVSPADVALLKDQMTLWEPPRVDVLIIATSGRFTTDAVAAIEKQRQSDRALAIEMWPETHLERLLAARPSLIATFGLR